MTCRFIGFGCRLFVKKKQMGRGESSPKFSFLSSSSIPISISGVVFLYYECWYYYLLHVVYCNVHMKMR